jgi:hypothetical protein
MGYSAKLGLSVALIATLIALYSVQHTSDSQLIVSDVSVGDNLDCGFTPDFQNFLNSNGNFWYLFRLWNLSIQQT